MTLRLLLRTWLTAALVFTLASCAHRFYSPSYMTDWHFDQVITAVVNKYFELNPQVGNRVAVDATSPYGDRVSSEFRAKGYEVEEISSGYRFEIYPYDNDESESYHLMVVSLNKRNGDRFNVLFRVMDDQVIADQTSVQRL